MKFLSLIAALVLLPWTWATAQVTVEVKLDQEQFLVGETLPVTVRIINRSGQTIKLGADPDWLTFSVEARDDFIVPKLGDAQVCGEFTIPSSQMATKRVDIAPYFGLTRQTRYTVTATVRLKDWDTQVVGGPRTFDIIDGAKLWSREFGVPIPAGVSNRPPEVRKYTLEQANYLRSQLRLYLRLTDPSENKIFKVFAVGPMVSFGQPDIQMDKDSNLYLLYQTGARSFNYFVFNPDGDTLIRQTYDLVDTRPHLQVTDNGEIRLSGGQRRITANDLPVETPPPATTP